MLPRLGCLGLLAMALLILTIKGAFGGRPMNAKELAGSAALLLLILFMPIAGLVVASASPVATTVLRADLPSQEAGARSEEHTSELQSLIRSAYAVFRLKKITSHTEDKQAI